MSNVILCTGSQSKSACHISKFDVNLHTIEELCYTICKNAYMLETSDFDDQLIEWIANGCRLEPLADLLDELREKKANVIDLAIAVLEYVQYNTPEEIEEVSGKLSESAHLDQYDRRMNRAYFLMDQGKYMQAQEMYTRLEQDLPQGAREQLAKVYHNQGVIWAKLFYFREAAECFQKEFGQIRTKDAVISYLCAVRMSMSEKEYVAFVAENKDAYSFSMDIEKKMNDAVLLYDAGDEKHRLRTLTIYKSEGNREAYRKGLLDITGELKTEYREHCLGGPAY